MGKQFMNQIGYSLLLVSLVITACTKTRDAKLPDDAAEGTYAISTFNDVSDNPTSTFTMKTSDTATLMDAGEQNKASNEMAIVAVDSDTVQVPDRIRYMFNDLSVSGQTGHSYGVAFTVDNKSLTAYKVVENSKDLSLLEKNIAVTRNEIVLQKKLIMSRGKASSQLMVDLGKAKNARIGALYVPIFKYDVKAFGVLERIKNEVGDETSVLRLRPTEWSQASHIQLSTTSSDRKLVGVDPNTQDELSRVFVADRVNNKIMTYAELNAQIQVGLNLDLKTRVMTLLDTDNMKVYEVTQLSKAKLTDAQKEILRTKAQNGQVAECAADVKKVLPVADQDGCILIQRFNVPVTYVRPELQVVDFTGNRSNTVQFKDLAVGEAQTGLVKIAKNVVPEEIQATDNLDPRKTLRISDIKNKEFFLRRTLEDVSAMGTLSGGMAGPLQLVKFELEDDRLVVKKTQSVISFKKAGAMEDEEVMSLPVSYVKRDLKDAAGKNLAIPRLRKVSKDEAEYAVINWTTNSIPVLNSPLAFYAEASCFANTNNTEIVDTEMRLTEGVLNFSYLYSVTIKPEEGCLSTFAASGDYNIGGMNYQFVQKVRERISFKVNDGSTDKSVGPKTPFTAQNALNFGAFTAGLITPTENGGRGMEGTQVNFPSIHDFTDRNKTYMYTVGGMPSAAQDPHRREVLKQIAKDVIADWNIAFHKAFVGTALDRTGNYLEVQFEGDNGVVAHLGDLDKNLIWFVDRPMDNGLLGVSQAAFNPRSGILAADSLIIYDGNNAGEVERWMRYYKMVKDFRTNLEKYKITALADMAKGNSDTDKKKALADAASTVAGDSAQKMLAPLMTPQKQARVSPLSASSLTQKDYSLGAPQFDKRSWTAPAKKFSANQTDEAYYLDRIFKKALANNNSGKAPNFDLIVAQEILSTFDSKLNMQEKSLLRQKVAMSKMHERLQKFFLTNPGCVKEETDTTVSEINEKYLAKSFEQAFVESTKATLAHELGHSMGLTHNFIGSFDKANFNFEGETSERNYSSIMDYINDTLQNYAGLGPYDVYAIRATYTGLIELRQSARNEKSLISAGFKGSMINGRFISIDDIQKSYAPNGWSAFTGGNAKDLIQPFKYCTDKDLGYEPTCRQFDFGTTPLEIVKNDIQMYENSYIIGRYGYDLLSFDWRNVSSVAGRSLTTMLTMRQFLDEGFYRLITGRDSGLQTETFAAAKEVYRFLLNVITTPDTDKDFLDFTRFKPVTYDRKLADGKTEKAVTFIEARQQATTMASPERYKVIGNEIDKTFAMQILTLKGIGQEKYDRMSLAVSYLDFEKVNKILGDDGISPVTGTFAQILTNSMNARKFLTDGVVRTDDTVTPTERMMAYAGISTVLALETDAVDQRDNFANLFKVGTSIGARPQDRLVLSPIGNIDKSSAAVSYWALDNANVSAAMLQAANQKYIYMALAEPLKPAFLKITKGITALALATEAKDQSAIGKANADIAAGSKLAVATIQIQNKDGKYLTKEALAADPSGSLEKQVSLMIEMNKGLAMITSALMAVKDGGDTSKIEAAADKYVELTTALAEKYPLLVAGQLSTQLAFPLVAAERSKELDGKEVQKDPMFMLLAVQAKLSKQIFQSATKTQADYGMIMNSIKFLATLTRMTNPEFSR